MGAQKKVKKSNESINARLALVMKSGKVDAYLHITTVSKRVPILGTFLTFWVPIYISGSLFSVFWLNSREECQLSLHVHNT